MRKVTAPRAAANASVRLVSGSWAGAHTMHRIQFHLVWIPKYRRRVLTGALAERLEELLRQACEVRGWGLHELSVQPDHVHLLLQVTATDCASDVLNSLVELA